MNCQQILTGACNASQKAFGVGSVEGNVFIAYAAGCNIVILDSSFERVQIIPGVVLDNVQISCIDCSKDVGKIAASYSNQICIFEPTPLVRQQTKNNLNYRWVKTAILKATCHVNCLVWHLEGTKLITGGDVLQVWNFKEIYHPPSTEPRTQKVTFNVGGGDEDSDIEDDHEVCWYCQWQCQTSSSTYLLASSSDGNFFATAGQNDCLVKIWFETPKCDLEVDRVDDEVMLDYDFIYIAHPQKVTCISWRETSKYMPKGCVATMLVTSCQDNICRVWVETFSPDDGLSNIAGVTATCQSSKYQGRRLRNKFLNPLKTIKRKAGRRRCLLIDYLDEFGPGLYRQAQVSFSTRIPNAFPINDASSMSVYIGLYLTYGPTNQETCSGGQTVYMVSKHFNGTLNLWHMSFSKPSKFTQILCLDHISRVCGHRFRVNDITCHPTLPLLLTTSHHNVPKRPTSLSEDFEENHFDVGFCSELILWHVEPVGPLSVSGGITELARISSPQLSAFSNCAWIPTLLPSSNLGTYANSPIACFVASDGHCLRVYEVILDARSLLAQVQEKPQGDLLTPTSSSVASSQDEKIFPSLTIISQQSTSRPGAIIELDQIQDASHDWLNTQLLLVLQEELIMGENVVEPVISLDSNNAACVDLQSSAMFNQPFYVILLEKLESGSLIHVWKLVMSSCVSQTECSDKFPEEEEDLFTEAGNSKTTPAQFTITTTRVCCQELPLPRGVDVVHAAPAAGHLSSASIYPACYAPYLITTACSDNKIRFWACDTTKGYKWYEWNMYSEEKISSIDIPGNPLYVSAAYNGRISCAYKSGKSFQDPLDQDPNSRYVNLCVAIFECESTGGSEWVLEDTISLKNIVLPKIPLSDGLDLSFLHSNRRRRLEHFKRLSSDDSTEKLPGLITVPSCSTIHTLRRFISEKGNVCPITQKHLVQLDWVSREDGSHILTIGVGNKIYLYSAVSSDIAQYNLKAMKESQNTSRPVLTKASSMAASQYSLDEVRWMKQRTLNLKSADGLPALPMQLSWVRDGILVIGMDNEMHIYTQWRSQLGNLGKSGDGTLSRCLTDSELLSIAPQTSFHKLAKPTSTSQLNRNVSFADRKKGLTGDLQNREFEESVAVDNGLFEASRFACPVLPQYHPKQLMELLTSGKIKRVKAILAHLVRYISLQSSLRRQGTKTIHYPEDSTEADKTSVSWGRARTLSLSYSPGSPLTDQHGSVFPEEVTLDYVEVDSVPPVPLWMLLAADLEKPQARAADDAAASQDYSELFGARTRENNLDDAFEDEDEGDLNTTTRSSERRRSAGNTGGISLTLFEPRQARKLSTLLTHSHLPGLSSLDQMHLLALADTVASFNTDLADSFGSDPNKETIPGSLDDCGLRFLLAMRHHAYLLRCLPLSQRALLQRQGLSSCSLVWAFHSYSQEDLLNMIPCVKKETPKWSELREVGVGWWVRSNQVLRTCLEKVAKVAFQAKQDPLDAAIYYIAMKKKSMLWGLYRYVNDRKMTEFFSNNFAEDRWRRAALTNAYALLGKQRFEHAAAFFLLAGSVKDCLEICVNKLEDLQLAMVISRMYEGDLDPCPPTLQKLLKQEILGDGHDDDFAHPDPFLRSMALWMMKDYMGSLNTLLLTDVGHEHPRNLSGRDCSGNPSVFNFYTYLRTHPVIVRQQLALCSKPKSSVLVTSLHKPISDDPTSKISGMTHLERRLYFATSHAHFRAGCPALALEVLSKLPSRISCDTPTSRAESAPDPVVETVAKVDDIDWSQPVCKKEVKLELQWSDDDEEEEEQGENKEEPEAPEQPSPEPSQERGRLDIMAQQLKFIACLHILMEELSTLATGCEVDGGQLRYHLYIWLEREVEALRHLCGYGACTALSEEDDKVFESTEEQQSLLDQVHEQEQALKRKHKLSLHEVCRYDKLDFEYKLERSARRKKWLKENEALLLTLLSYCSLHGAGGGGLMSVRMELVLLMQELHQERSQQQLQSPLPFPTTLPLISTSVADHKFVVNDPIHQLQNMTHDLLHTFAKLQAPPLPIQARLPLVFILRDLSTALSSCIYQSLCDCDTFINNCPTDVFLESFINLSKSHLTGGLTRRRKFSLCNDEEMSVHTTPSKWPGVTSLISLLARGKDEDSPKLSILLCESFVSVYMSLLTCALVTCDCYTLFRLVTKSFTEKTWGLLFGGGTKFQVNVTIATSAAEARPSTEEQSKGLLETLNKQRLKLNMKLLGHSMSQGSATRSPKEDRPVYREVFVPPQYSIASYLMTKCDLDSEFADLDYDSSGSMSGEDQWDDDIEEDDDEDAFRDDISGGKAKEVSKPNTEHSDPGSYSWSIIRCAVVRAAHKFLLQFLVVADIKLEDLPIISPLIHNVLQLFDLWVCELRDRLNEFGGSPPNFIPGCFMDKSFDGPTIQKYKIILDPNYTPYLDKKVCAPMKRLWCYLVRQEVVQDIFIRYIFGSQRRRSVGMDESVTVCSGSDVADEVPPTYSCPIRIIHKDQEPISAFCVNQTQSSRISISTPKEIQELDISLLLDAGTGSSWLESECEFDILNLYREADHITASNFLVVQTPNDSAYVNNSAYNNPAGIPQSGRGTSVILKHKIEGTRKLTAHPLLPMYLSGCQDGSIQLWEWTYDTMVSQPRAPGTFAKVSQIRFSHHGNKFGVADGDGKVSLWQLGLTTLSASSYFSHQCHSKQASDFVFLGSSSLFASAGLSGDGKNVAIWDTLLPARKALVQGFTKHDHGASCLLYAANNQVLISAGKRGQISLIDLRQRTIRHQYQAHNSAIRCMALDPMEEYFLTGSADGDIKVWSLNGHSELQSFQGEHPRSSFFRHMGQTGVTQIYVDSSGRMFSCGNDGSIKFRQLPNKS